MNQTTQQILKQIEDVLNAKTGGTILIYNQDTNMTFFLTKDVEPETLEDILAGLLTQIEQNSLQKNNNQEKLVN